MTNFGVQDESNYELDKDPTVALVQASVIAARHGMAIPSELTPDILTLRDDEPDVGECDYTRTSAPCVRAAIPTRTSRSWCSATATGRCGSPRSSEIAEREGYRTYYLVKPNCTASLVEVGDLDAGNAAVGRVRRLPGAGPSTRSPSCTPTWSWCPAAAPTRSLYDDDGNEIPQRRPGVRRRYPGAGYDDLFRRPRPAADQTVLIRDVPKSEELPDPA